MSILNSNFVIYVDRGGNMPQLRHHRNPKPWGTHPYWTRYVGDKPVSTHPAPGTEKVYDYSIQEYVPLSRVAVV